MTDEETVSRAELLLARASHARQVSGLLLADRVGLTRRVAATEEAVARTLGRMALQLPRHECRLLAMSEAAASQAARQRRWADERPTGLRPPG